MRCNVLWYRWHGVHCGLVSCQNAFAGIARCVWTLSESPRPLQGVRNSLPSLPALFASLHFSVIMHGCAHLPPLRFFQSPFTLPPAHLPLPPCGRRAGWRVGAPDRLLRPNIVNGAWGAERLYIDTMARLLREDFMDVCVSGKHFPHQ